MQTQLSSILPKLHLRLMPTLLMMYVLAFLDRANVGFAKAGLPGDAGIGDAAFAFGASIFFVGYAVLEVPSNLILHRVGRAALAGAHHGHLGPGVGGHCLCAQRRAAFYAVRFLLGIAEAGFFPGVIYYLTFWYPTAARARSVGLFYYGAPLALTFGGPLSGLLVAHDAFGLHGWQMMFLIEGLMASPGRHRGAVPAEGPARRGAMAERGGKSRLLRPRWRKTTEVRESPACWRTLRDPRVLFLALVYFLVEMGFYGLTFYLPTQVAQAAGQRAWDWKWGWSRPCPGSAP